DVRWIVDLGLRREAARILRIGVPASVGRRRTRRRSGMNTTVSIVVVIVVLMNIAAMMALLIGLRRRHGEASTTTETTGHTWDGDLRELNNPLPRWWLWLFVGTVVFGLIYLAIYPGLGNFAGTSGWSSQRQLAEQSAEADKL